VSNDYVGLWKRFFREVWSERREATIDELIAEDFELIGVGPEPMRGRESFRAWWKQFPERFDSATLEIVDGCQEGDMVSVRTKGTLCPRHSSQELTFGGVAVAWLRDGQFIRTWEAWDTGLLLECSGKVAAGTVQKLLNLPGAETTEDACALWERWYRQVWGERSEAAIDAMLAPDAKLWAGDAAMDVEGFKALWRGVLKRYSSVKGTILHSVCEGDWISVQSELELTDPTGTVFRVSGQQRAIVREGRFSEVWDAWSWVPHLEATGELPGGALQRFLAPS